MLYSPSATSAAVPTNQHGLLIARFANDVINKSNSDKQQRKFGRCPKVTLTG